jgi:hypothetical protein
MGSERYPSTKTPEGLRNIARQSRRSACLRRSTCVVDSMLHLRIVASLWVVGKLVGTHPSISSLHITSP